ncbi:hypothetical protein ETD86_29430 [Nonomuraea turkmeniaca]|uniref:Uncharacterized protein n=1 Tax=Nonomuraea turkmeniaca TaxID=103838 RepID=A0A5S4FUT0_9ACTN|nr:hypothetical protein ETD86_29430 [Nonomuraea turkmeniaca]
MSRIYFTAPAGRAELHGSENAHLGLLCQRIADDVLVSGGPELSERLRSLIPPDHYLYRDAGRPGGFSAFRACFGRDDPPLLVYNGSPLSTFEMAFNTALHLGSDAVRLAARVYAQSELHAFVEGGNRAWLAGLIDAGLAEGVLRRTLPWRGQPSQYPSGWEKVASFLRERDNEPVVLSSTLAGSWFPSAVVAGWRPPAGTDLMPASWRGDPEWDELDDDDRAEYEEMTIEELFDELTAAEQHRLGMQGLRRRSDGGMLLELKPAGWERYRFGHCLSLLDVAAADWRERIEARLNGA